MTDIDTIRETSRRALLTPGEALGDCGYDEHLEAVKAAPVLLKTLLALYDEQAARARFATARADDWFSIAIRQRDRIEELTHESWSSRGLRNQNAHVKELYKRERRKRQAAALRAELEDAETLTTSQAIERWQNRNEVVL